VRTLSSVLSHPRALDDRPCFRSGRSALVQPPRVSYAIWFRETHVRPRRGILPLMRFLFPSASAGCAALSRGGQPRGRSHFDVRSPRFRFARQPIAGGLGSRTRASATRKNLVPVVLEFAFAPCVIHRARHAPRGPSRFTPVRSGHAPRSLFGAAFRYPLWSNPVTTGPHARVFLSGQMRQRSWDS
jgi:hypothetical protein